VRYALAVPMSGLYACPFCRQLFQAGEARTCPECGLKVESLTKLPPSYDAKLEDEPEEPVPPHMETLPWTFAGRGRAVLLVLAIAGLVAFFSPWVREAAPEVRELSGFGLARITGLFWAPAIAWFVIIPLVVTRRSIYKMRGARVAIGFLAGVALVSVMMLLSFPPKSSRRRIVRIEWQWGLYASAVIAAAGVGAAARFGGRLDDIPTKQERRGDEILH
jgi:hypothetical protein